LSIRIGQKTEYFLSSQSGRGIVTFLKDALRLQKRQIILKGGTDQIRSRIIRNVGIEFMDRGYNIEIAHGVLNPDNLEGVFIPQLSFAIVSGTPYLENKFYKNIIDLDHCQDSEKYLVYQSKIEDLLEQINVNQELVFEELQKISLSLFDKCVNGYELEERQALYIAEKLLQTLFTLDEGRMNHRFGQVLTCRGLVNYLPRILANCEAKYYINGIHYQSRSRILNLVAREAVLKGLVVDVYHNFFNPELIEVILLKELDLAVAIRPFTGDFQQLISYEGFAAKNDNGLYLENLNFEEALKWLREVEALYEQCCIFYHETLNFAEIAKLEKELIFEILKITN